MNETDLENRQLSWIKLSFLCVFSYNPDMLGDFEDFSVVKVDLKSKSCLPVCYEIHTDNVCVSIAMNPESRTSFNHKMGVISAWHNRRKM